MTNETKPNYKAIKLEDINALQRYFGDSHDGCRHIGYFTEDNQGTAVLLDDLRALYDNAPSVGDSEPFCWAVDCKKEYYDVYNHDERNVIVSDEIFLRDYLEDSNAWIITPLYTTPQTDRVAELEAKLKYAEGMAQLRINQEKLLEIAIESLEAELKEYEADAKRWRSLKLVYADNPNVTNYHKATLHVPWLYVKEYTKASFNEAIDQAMKG